MVLAHGDGLRARLTVRRLDGAADGLADIFLQGRVSPRDEPLPGDTYIFLCSLATSNVHFGNTHTARFRWQVTVKLLRFRRRHHFILELTNTPTNPSRPLQCTMASTGSSPRVIVQSSKYWVVVAEPVGFAEVEDKPARPLGRGQRRLTASAPVAASVPVAAPAPGTERWDPFVVGYEVFQRGAWMPSCVL